MYIETSRIYNPGTILMIRKAHRSPWVSDRVAGETLPPPLCLAEVKWIKELAQEDFIRFGMGLALM